jgi:hypothetical protein
MAHSRVNFNSKLGIKYAWEWPAQPKYVVGTEKIHKNFVVADSSMYVNIWYDDYVLASNAPLSQSPWGWL